MLVTHSTLLVVENQDCKELKLGIIGMTQSHVLSLIGNSGIAGKA